MKHELIITTREELSEILFKIFQEGSPKKTEQPENTPMGIEDAASFLGKSKGTIYNLVSTNKICFHKRNGRLYFFRDELIEWIKSH